MGVILITHDMAVVAENCDRVIVMYLGHIVEEAPKDELIHHPKHPYTKSLLVSVPSMNPLRISCNIHVYPIVFHAYLSFFIL